jgi:hypothetical protein
LRFFRIWIKIFSLEKNIFLPNSAIFPKTILSPILSPFSFAFQFSFPAQLHSIFRLNSANLPIFLTTPSILQNLQKSHTPCSPTRTKVPPSSTLVHLNCVRTKECLDRSLVGLHGCCKRQCQRHHSGLCSVSGGKAQRVIDHGDLDLIAREWSQFPKETGYKNVAGNCNGRVKVNQVRYIFRWTGTQS